MSKVCILAVIIAGGYFHVVQGRVFTEYEQHPVNPKVGLLQCGLNATAFDYCAVRETNGTCYPLTTDWCQLKDMSVDGNYLIKKTVVENFPTPNAGGYYRPLPVALTDGSELEFRFDLPSTWDFNHAYYVDLHDNSNNIVLHVKLRGRNPDDFYFGSLINGAWGPTEGYFDSLSFKLGVEYVLRIACRTNHYEIFLNGVMEWTYTHRLPLNTVVSVDSGYYGSVGNIFKVTYKA